MPAASDNDTKFDLGFGAFYTQTRMGSFDDFYAGISATHLLSPVFNLQAVNIDFQFVPHVYAIVGANKSLGGAMVLEPSILVKYRTEPQIDLNATVLYAGSFRGGLGFRQWGNSDAVTVLLGYETGALKVGYSFDLTLSKIQSVSNNTHEAFVAYCLPIKISSPPPKDPRLTPRFL